MNASSVYYIRCMVYPTNIGPTVVSSIPGGTSFWIGTYGGTTTVDEPRVGYQIAALFINAIDRLTSIVDLSIIN